MAHSTISAGQRTADSVLETTTETFSRLFVAARVRLVGLREVTKKRRGLGPLVRVSIGVLPVALGKFVFLPATFLERTGCNPAGVEHFDQEPVLDLFALQVFEQIAYHLRRPAAVFIRRRRREDVTYVRQSGFKPAGLLQQRGGLVEPRAEPLGINRSVDETRRTVPRGEKVIRVPGASLCLSIRRLGRGCC